MRARAIRSGLTLVAIAATALGQTATVEAYEYRDFPINVQLPASPAPVPMHDGRWLLAYHLFLSNWAYTPVTLKEFQVLDEATATLGPAPVPGRPPRRQPWPLNLTPDRHRGSGDAGAGAVPGPLRLTPTWRGPAAGDRLAQLPQRR